MFNKKRKILFCSEASFSNTGYGSIYRELISRVHASGKFRVAEFATGSLVHDNRIDKVKWRFYANNVEEKDPRHKEYDSVHENSFGAWRFNNVLLDFEPDIVIDIRDPVVFQHQSFSPLRPYFHWFIMPTVDSAPQPVEWLSVFMSADTVTTYTEFGNQTLKDTGLKIKLIDTLGPGINTEIFKPLNKAAVRSKYGIDPGSKILGFISRNQIRKLYPSLFKCFAEAIKSEANTEKCYLHCHTAFPDLKPWNIPRLLLEYDIANNVLFTYFCNSCKRTMISKWKGSVNHCQHCGDFKAIHPTTMRGCTQEEMVEIYNLYDSYIQYVNCEGMGMGLIEASACAIPITAPSYSAMGSILSNVGGQELGYTLTRDVNTDAERAIPNEDDTVRAIKSFIKNPKEILHRRGFQQKELCDKRYSWDIIAEKWIEALENVSLTGNQGQWGSILRKPTSFKSKSENSMLDEMESKLISCGILSGSKNQYLLHEMYYKFMLYMGDHKVFGWSPDTIENFIKHLEQDKKDVTQVMSGQVKMMSEDFIQYADMVEVSNL